MTDKEFVFDKGHHFGYPECCIEWFWEHRFKNGFDNLTELTEKQESVHGFRGFIPCPICAEKVTKETLHTLIQNRKEKQSFPST